MSFIESSLLETYRNLNAAFDNNIQDEVAQLLYQNKKGSIPKVNLLEDLVDKLHLEISNVVLSDKSIEPPDDLTINLDREQMILEHFINHIEGQKQQVIVNFSKAAKELQLSLNQVRDKILLQLDIQSVKFRLNLDEFRYQIKKYYQYDNGKKFDKEYIMNQLSLAKDPFDFKSRIRRYLDDIKEGSMSQIDSRGSSFIVKDDVIDSLQNINKQIDHMNENYPFTNAARYDSIKSCLTGIKKKIAEINDHLAEVINPISPLEIGISESEIIKHDSMKEQIKSYVNPEAAGLELRMASKLESDGSNFKEVMSIFYELSDALILFRTANGEILGCYRDKPRTPSKDYQLFQRFVRFSLTKGKKSNGGVLPRDKNFYSLDEFLHLTYNFPCKRNQSLFEDMKKYGVNIKPFEYACLCINQFTSNTNRGSLANGQYYSSVFVGVTQLEVFQVQFIENSSTRGSNGSIQSLSLSNGSSSLRSSKNSKEVESARNSAQDEQQQQQQYVSRAEEAPINQPQDSFDKRRQTVQSSQQGRNTSSYSQNYSIDMTKVWKQRATANTGDSFTILTDANNSFISSINQTRIQTNNKHEENLLSQQFSFRGNVFEKIEE